MKDAEFLRAFPIQWTNGNGNISGYDGMSLRDYFAGQALIALMSSPAWVNGLDGAVAKGRADFKGCLAVNAYTVADAMLEARK